MAVNKDIYKNELGLPLNSVCWLEMHHFSKFAERVQMIRDLHLLPGSLVVDAGCGPGLWTPLLAEAVGAKGRIIGVDISKEALITAKKRSLRSWYRHQVQYKCASLDRLPLDHAEADVIFCANVCMYLPDPVAMLTSIGHHLRPGGMLAVKDIDSGTISFSQIDRALYTRVAQAREHWERERVSHGYTFEDSWVGSKLAGYLRAAGYQNVHVQAYPIVRRYPLTEDFRAYLQGLAEWFVSEGASRLDQSDEAAWLRYFLDAEHCLFDDPDFTFEEMEYLVTGYWPGPQISTTTESILCSHRDVYTN